MSDRKRVTEPGQARIIIVEDNLSNFRLMARLLLASGVTQYEWKTSGAQLVEPAGVQPPADLILLDIYLPGESGYEIVARLRQNPAFANTSIVAVTSEASDDNLQQARQAGFDGFIGKPISTSRFPDQVRNILRGEAVWEL